MASVVATEFVPVPGVVLDRFTALGVDVPRVLRHAGIASSRFATSRAKLTVMEFFALWRALEVVGGRRDLGLRIGKDAAPHQLDVASMAAFHSANLGEALAKFARYKRLVCGEQVTIETGGGEARIRFAWVHVEEQLPLLLVDVTFASLLSLACNGTGRSIVPKRVELARRRNDEALLRQHFGCPIVFDTPIDLLVLEERALVLPFVTHNADLLAMFVPSLEAALEEAGAARTIADDVRAVLRRRMNGERPSVEKIASDLRMSMRTLQRRLGESGVTYQELLDGVRRDTSRRLLASTDLDAQEIAFLVGFEELNSFSRAFHSWEGVTPNRWRERLGDPTVDRRPANTRR
jgi:AraC-like DNA-binding protein